MVELTPKLKEELKALKASDAAVKRVLQEYEEAMILTSSALHLS